MKIEHLSERFDRFAARALTVRPDWTTETAFASLMNNSSELEWVDSDLAVLLPLSDQLVLVDLIAGTSAVENPYRRPPDGVESTEWTTHFEDQVQGAIDDSEWGKSAEARALRHRTLRRKDNTAITEIDAVAMRGDILLLVSVKAWTQPEMLEFGEYESVNNRAIEVGRSVADWNSKVLELSVHPAVRVVAGSARLVAVVISPEVQYVLPGVSTVEVLPGLLSASSYLEFERFLAQ